MLFMLLMFMLFVLFMLLMLFMFMLLMIIRVEVETGTTSNIGSNVSVILILSLFSLERVFFGVNTMDIK